MITSASNQPQKLVLLAVVSVRYGHVSGVDTCHVFLLQTRAVPVCGGPQHPGQDRQAALPAGPQEHHQVRVGRDISAVTLCVLILQSGPCIYLNNLVLSTCIFVCEADL